VIDFKMPLQQSIVAPRLFQMASGALNVEGRYPVAAIDALRKMGHTVTVRGDFDAYFGGVHAILFDHDAGMLFGAADPRRDGQAVAY